MFKLHGILSTLWIATSIYLSCNSFTVWLFAGLYYVFTYHAVVYLLKVDVVSLVQSGEGGDSHFCNKELMYNLRVISFQLMVL